VFCACATLRRHCKFTRRSLGGQRRPIGGVGRRVTWFSGECSLRLRTTGRAVRSATNGRHGYPQSWTLVVSVACRIHCGGFPRRFVYFISHEHHYKISGWRPKAFYGAPFLRALFSLTCWTCLNRPLSITLKHGTRKLQFSGNFTTIYSANIFGMKRAKINEYKAGKLYEGSQAYIPSNIELSPTYG